MTASDISLRVVTAADLDDINRVIDAAILTWDLPERVKRLSLSSYHYNDLDLQHYTILVAVQADQIVGVVAWDTQVHQLANQQQGLLLHGIYVHPDHQQQGIGTRMFNRAEQAVIATKLDGLLVKAQKDAEAFYQSRGMHKLAVTDSQREFAARYWKPVS